MHKNENMNIIGVMKNKLGLSRKQYFFRSFGALVYPLFVFGFIKREGDNRWCNRNCYVSSLLFPVFLQRFFSQTLAKKKIVVSIIVAISALCTFVILYQANWIFGDDYLFMTKTAVNKYVDCRDFMFRGRFFPLGHFHYNFPLLLFRSLGINTGFPVEGHFALISIFFIVSYVCLYLLFNKIESSKNNKCLAFSLFFASTFFLFEGTLPMIFLRLIYPETQIIVLFSIFMLMYYKALETDKTRYYVIALLAVVYSTYCKEPVFGVFFVIVLINHLFRYKKESKREKIFYMTLIANGVIFLILYYFLSYRNAVSFYNESYEGKEVDMFRFLIPVFTKNPTLIIMFLLGLIRAYYIIVKNRKKQLYYDSLLFAGIAYVIAFIMLGLRWDYYFMPSIILFLPSFVYWTKYMYEKKRMYALCLFFVLLPIYTNNSTRAITTTKDIWRERQEFVPYITNLLSEYNDGKEFIWYTSKIVDTNTNYDDWEHYVLNIFFNHFNKSEKKEFFIVKGYSENVELKDNALLFSLAGRIFDFELIKTLQDNDFELSKDNSYYPSSHYLRWVFIYTKKELK